MQTPMEPVPTEAGRCSPCRLAGSYFMATRPMFLSASLLAVLAGTSLGWDAAGRLDLTAAALALLAVTLLHAASNVLNDVYDELNGADRLNTQRIFPYTGGSRFIQNGVLSIAQMRGWGVILLCMASLLGLWLGVYRGSTVLLLGLAGIGLGVLYSAPPVQLSARGLGELAVAAGFGILPVSGAAWLQSGEFQWGALLLSIPVSCWVANILLINEVPDARSDALAGKRTLVVRLGMQGAAYLYAGLGNLAILSIFAAVMLTGQSPWLLLSVVVLPVVVMNARTIREHNTDKTALKGSIEKTLAIHAAGCVYLACSPWF